MKKLLFIDSNIYLDFYRVRNEASISLLHRLDTIRDSVIVTYQVEMEFKKNRQTAILESLNQLKPPTKIPRPPILSDHKSYLGLQNDLGRCEDKIRKLQKRLQKVFAEPVRHDPVYKVVQRILAKKDDLNLTRQSKIKNRIRRQAFRRFMLGYPPRKPGDTSIGDSVNWEWICEVCKTQKAAALIVSRDSDYGVTLNGTSYINDWLDSEFRDRVSLQREIRLTGKLSEALKDFNQIVTPEEEKAEVEFIKGTARPIARTSDELQRLLESLSAEDTSQAIVLSDIFPTDQKSEGQKSKKQGS